MSPVTVLAIIVMVSAVLTIATLVLDAKRKRNDERIRELVLQLRDLRIEIEREMQAR